MKRRRETWTFDDPDLGEVVLRSVSMGQRRSILHEIRRVPADDFAELGGIGKTMDWVHTVLFQARVVRAGWMGSDPPRPPGEGGPAWGHDLIDSVGGWTPEAVARVFDEVTK